MNDLLLAISIITSILWSVGYFAFRAGAGIHILFGIAIVSIMVQLIRRRRSFPNTNKFIKS
jgi:hypothetical protein